MKDREICVNVYSKPESKIVKTINGIKKQLKEYSFSFFDINDPPPPQKVVGALIIIEETSVKKDIFTAYKDIIESYKYEPFFIICSEKPDFRNAVKWMKNDSRDYIDSNYKYSKEEFQKVLDDAFSILNKDYFDEKTDQDPFNFPPVVISSKNNWESLESNAHYDMSVLMLAIILKEELNKYSKDDLDNIMKKIEDYVTSMILNLGGKKLFWNYDNGIFVFHFGDRINCAALSAILILNKLKIFIFETLSLYELFDIKITIHDGKIQYFKNNTKFITSDTINSVVHLQNHANNLNSIDITENVYESLNPRVRKFFYDDILFEGRSIYTYYFSYYNKK